MNNLDFAGTEYSSENSIEGWQPIGNKSTPFKGTFKGGGYSINNLYINREFEDYIGLFGYMEGTSVDSLIISNCNIKGQENVGAISGKNYSDSDLSYCHISGTISGESYVGGLTGYNQYYNDITHCSVAANVSGIKYVGGFIGRNENSTIEYGYSTSDVYGESYIGGLTGSNFCTTILNSYTTGNITGVSDIGGLAAYMGQGSDIINSYSTADVFGGANVGGLTGSAFSYYSEITNCFYGGNTNGKRTVGLLKSLRVSIENVYYNKETSDKEEPVSTTGLTTFQMKLDSSFAGFNFDTIWCIRNDSTYPALRSINNAPFAFPGTFEGSLSRVFKNNYDYESLQNNLVYDIDSVVSLVSGTEYTTDTSFIDYPDSLVISYRVGEYHEETNDTLWGNRVTSYLVPDFINHAPIITSAAPLTAMDGVEYIYNVLATDEDDDELTFSLTNQPDDMTITGNTITWMPPEGITTSGEITITVSDSELTDTETFTIAVSGNGQNNLENIETNNIVLYPIPVDEVLTIQSSSILESFQLISSTGIVLLNETVTGTEAQLDLQAIDTGIYYIKISAKSGCLVEQIIKN
jgi:hypothetical protein